MKCLIVIGLSGLVVALCGLTCGCSTTYGDTSIKSHFAFPNSNIQPLGEVTAIKSKTSVFLPRQITHKDLVNATNEALAQKSGADLLINVKQDVTVTQIPLPILTIFVTKLKMSGTAAKMEVGEKYLDVQKQMQYTAK